MTSIVESTTAAGSVIEIVPPAAAGPLTDATPIAVELCPEHNLGLRTTHERQRLLRQKALGWN